jgi:hypothetical protein
MSIEFIDTHTILPDIVSPGSIAVDCGANVGRFSSYNEPDMQISRIRLSHKTSRLHPRHLAPKRG